MEQLQESEYPLLLSIIFSFFLATWERLCAFFKLPDFILSVQLLQFPKTMLFKKKKKKRKKERKKKIEPQPFCITFKKVAFAEGNFGH